MLSTKLIKVIHLIDQTTKQIQTNTDKLTQPYVQSAMTRQLAS